MRREDAEAPDSAAEKALGRSLGEDGIDRLEKVAKEWEHQVDSFMESDSKNSMRIYKVMDTPIVFTLLNRWEDDFDVKLGKEVAVTHTILWKILREAEVAGQSHGHASEMSVEVIKELPKSLADPIMILRNRTNKKQGSVEIPNEVIVVVDLKDNHGKTIIVPIVLKEVQNRYMLKTSFGKDDARWFQERLMLGDILYIHKEKALNWVKAIQQHQWLGRLTFQSSFIKSIPSDKDLVKVRIKNLERYQTAYHFTPNAFDEFDLSRADTGIGVQKEAEGVSTMASVAEIYEDIQYEREQFFDEVKYNQDRFVDFISTMARFYKYPLNQQVDLHLHGRETDTAVATAEFWQRLGNPIREDAIGVDVYDDQTSTLKTLYDISDTLHPEKEDIQQTIWNYNPEKHNAILLDLTEFQRGAESDEIKTDPIPLLLYSIRQKTEDAVVSIAVQKTVLTRLGIDGAYMESVDRQLAFLDADEISREQLEQIHAMTGEILSPIAARIREVNRNGRIRDERTGRDRDGGSGGVGSRVLDVSGIQGDAGAVREEDGREPGGVGGSGRGAVRGGGMGVRDEEEPEEVSQGGLDRVDDQGRGSVPEHVSPSASDADGEDREGLSDGRGAGERSTDGRGAVRGGELGSGEAELSSDVGSEDVVEDAARRDGEQVSDEGTRRGRGDLRPIDQAGDERGRGLGDGEQDVLRVSEEQVGNTALDIDLSSFDYHADMRTAAGKRAVFDRNLAAIRVSKNLEETGRTATEEEVRLLKSYAGFGGIAEAFDPRNEKWSEQYDALRRHLTDDEFDAAAATTLDSHYTPPEIIEGIYQGLEHIGFTGGNILEPSVGSGRFFEHMPTSIKGASNLVGVEIDPLTARIAKYAYPEAEIVNQGFETTRFQDGAFDLAISNVPFGEETVVKDAKYAGANLKIHDYFINKMIDSVRPGGLAVAITSSGTMDKKYARAREMMAEKADLVTAIRLPDTAFKSAGTDVTTDILVFRKKDPTKENTREHLPEERAWTRVADTTHLSDWKKDKKGNPVKDTGASFHTSEGLKKGASIPFQDSSINAYYFDQNTLDDRHKLLQTENILGEVVKKSSRYGAKFGVAAKSDGDLKRDIAAVFAGLSTNIYERGAENPKTIVQDAEKDPRPSGFYLEKDVLVYVNPEGRAATDFDTTYIYQAKARGKKVQRDGRALLISAVKLRDKGHELLQAELQGCTNEEMYALQGELNDLYDDHVKAHGNILFDQGLDQLFSYDAGYNFIRAYENYDERTQTFSKADMFHQRTILPQQEVGKADTPQEALIHSIAEKGKVDFAYMASLLDGMETREIINELEHKQIFFDLATNTYQEASEYLSGNIRVKMDAVENRIHQLNAFLAIDRYIKEHPEEADTEKTFIYWLKERKLVAWGGTDCLHIPPAEFREMRKSLAPEEAVKEIASLQKNLEALELAKPKDVAFGDIGVGLGTSWLPVDYIQSYINERFRPWGYPKVEKSEETGKWYIRNGNGAAKKFSGYDFNPREEARGVITDHGQKNVYELLENALNLTFPVMRKPRLDSEGEEIIRPDGQKVTTVDEHGTILAQEKQNQLKADFLQWLAQDRNRVEWVETYYNRHFNCIKPRVYDGSHLTFPGMTANPNLQPRPHQKNAVAHSLYGGNTLFAHAVGAGKTFEMAAGIMEAKRLGQASKGLMVVPNHLTEQTGEEFQKFYPQAKILVATKENMKEQNVEEFLSRVATGDWDAVVVGFTHFEKIALTPERQMRFYNKQIEELREILRTQATDETDKKAGQRDFTVKAIQGEIGRLNKELDRLKQRIEKQTKTLTFEELGIDKLCIDEAHYFKNLTTPSQINADGAGKDKGSNRAFDLLMKTEYLNELTGYKGVIFATGTPISNSVSELYVMHRYLAPHKLEAMGIRRFDDWASTYGEITVQQELKPEGKGYRPKARFAKFKNVPELRAMFADFADIQTEEMLKEANNMKLPDAEIIVVQTKPTDLQKEIINSFVERAEMIRAGRPATVEDVNGDPIKDTMLKITHEGRSLSLDQRILHEGFPDDPNSKVNQCVDKVVDVYRRTQDAKGTQIIFCDQSTSTGKNKGKFNVYDDVIEKLVARGIPREEIKVAQETKDEEEKMELFKQVRRGEVRVLLGSTDTLGVGTNVQTRLAALHDLSVPWRPSDLTQRIGRAVRPGNENEKVEIYRYITEDTFDAYMWQLLESKQKFISQMMNGDVTGRTIEEVDEVTLSFAELKAIATGNPYLKEKMTVETELMKIEVAKAGYVNGQQRLKKQIEVELPKEIAKAKERIDKYTADLMTMQKSTDHDESGKEVFSIRLNGKVYTDMKTADKVLKSLKGVRDCGAFKGEYKGLQMRASMNFMTFSPVITLFGRDTYDVPISEQENKTMQDIKGTAKEIQKLLEKERGRLERAKQDLESAQEVIQTPFKLAEKEAALRSRLNELNALMAKAADEDKALPTMQETQETYDPVKLVASIPKQQLPSPETMEAGKERRASMIEQAPQKAVAEYAR